MKAKPYLLLFIIVDLVTFGLGIWRLVTGILGSYAERSDAAWGGLLITLGFLVRHWTPDIRSLLTDAEEPTEQPKEAPGGSRPNTGLVVGLAIIISAAMYSNLSGDVSSVSTSIDNTDRGVYDVQRSVDRIEQDLRYR